MENPASAKLVSRPMMVFSPSRIVAAIAAAEIGAAGLLDSPEPGMSGTITLKSRSNASTLRAQCIQLPVPPCNRTSGEPLPQLRQTTSPPPLGVVWRVLARSSAVMNSAGVFAVIISISLLLLSLLAAKACDLFQKADEISVT